MAYDLNRGQIIWDKPYGDDVQLAARGITGTGSLFPTNSLIANGGGLLFSTTNDRQVRAWDRATGEVLWSANLPADPGGMPGMYRVDNVDFLVVSATRGDRQAYGRDGQYTYIAYRLPKL